MATEGVEPMATCHVVAMPYPGRGHINPMMNLCKLLASRINHLLITVIVTEEWFGLIGSESKPANIHFVTIPNVLPSELARASNMVAFLDAIMTKMEEPFEQLLDRLEPPAPAIIIADTFFSWAVDIGKRRNIPVASLWAMPASVFSFFHHFDLFVRNQDFPVELSERGDERVEYIPGVSSFRLADLPSIFHIKDQKLLRRVVKMISNVTDAQFLLFNSIFELEVPVFNALKAKFPFPVYSFGPLLPHFNLGHNGLDLDYLKWLDSQPPSSVLYVSLGSFLSVSSAQMEEIAAGLRSSGVRYLWVARGEEASRFKEDCGGAGMVVPWCDQVKVLCHSSVGGFWTHCGWNSTTEGIFAGVPFLAFPLMMDQVPISKFIEEDWKIGWKMKREVGREEIAELVQRFMDLENSERKEMTERARKLKEICRGAIEKGGSSESNLDAFIRHFTMN